MSEQFDITKIQWKWVLVSIGIFFVAQLVVGILYPIFVILTLGIGILLIILVKPIIFFIGGFVTGYLSPGITIYEPAIGAIIFSILGATFEIHRGFFSTVAVIVGTVIAFICALIGARFGEKVQLRK